MNAYAVVMQANRAFLAQCVFVKSFSHCFEWLRLMGMCCAAGHIYIYIGNVDVSGEGRHPFTGGTPRLCLFLLPNEMPARSRSR